MANTLRLPSSFTPTHDTAGLNGYQAVDVFGVAGSNVQAPATGTIEGVHFIPWDAAKKVGGYTGYLITQAGTYFLTHLGNLVSGNVQAGQTIGTLASVPGGAWSPHIHEGLNKSVTQASQVGYLGGTGMTSTGGTSNANAAPGFPTSDEIRAAQQRIVADAKKAGIDPAAVLAVASYESGNWSGSPNPSKTAFGPGQMLQGNGHLAGTEGQKVYDQFGWQAANLWAWSNQGIDTFVNQVAGVTKGKKGAAAIRAQIDGYEKPGGTSSEPGTDAGQEYAAAVQRYTGYAKAIKTGSFDTPTGGGGGNDWTGWLEGAGNAALFGLPGLIIGGGDLPNVVGGTVDVAKGTADAISSVPKFLRFITSWRFAEVLGGIILLILGLALLGRQYGLNAAAPVINIATTGGLRVPPPAKREKLYGNEGAQYTGAYERDGIPF